MYYLRWHFVLVGVLFVFDIVVGLGVIAPTVGFVVAFCALWRVFVWKHPRSHLFRVAAVYALLGFASVFAIAWNSKLAMDHANPVIAAVEKYHSEQGLYPESLEELVPRYMPNVPRAGFTWVSSTYRYDAHRPQLYFAAMFHGVYFYDFSAGKWLANE